MKAVFACAAVTLGIAAAAAPTASAAVAPGDASEIERGASAALDCYQRFPALTQAADFAGCVQEVHASNRRRVGTGYEAFDAGLYFRAAQFIRIKIELLQDGDPGAGDLASLRAVLGPLEADSDTADAELHVSNSDVADILVIH
jgi:hypothetical protein